MVIQGKEDVGPNQGKYNGPGVSTQSQGLREVELTGIGA